jgi:glycosyltransferase involved in cell wall biosynthesis
MKVLALWEGMGGVEYHRLYTPLKRLQIDYPDDITVSISQNFERNGIPHLSNYDLVIFNRWLGDNHYEILHYLAKNNIKYIVDIDDYWVLPKHHPTYKYFREHKLKQQIIDGIRYADGVTTTTDYLAKKIAKYNHNVQVLPNALDLTDDQWLATPQDREYFTFGWVGGLTHSNDIMILSEAIERICNEHDNVRFVLCGWMANNYIWDSILYKFNGNNPVLRPQVLVSHAQQPNEYGNFYRLFDCALAPLEQNEWNSCKSELKIIEAAAYGLPVIASGVEPYLQHLNNAGVKFCLNTPDEWYKAIKQAMDSQPKVNQIRGTANQVYCNQHHNLEAINKDRLEFYQCTLATPGHS